MLDERLYYTMSQFETKLDKIFKIYLARFTKKPVFAIINTTLDYGCYICLHEISLE